MRLIPKRAWKRERRGQVREGRGQVSDTDHRLVDYMGARPGG
jgi:hypothetical protein